MARTETLAAPADAAAPTVAQLAIGRIRRGFGFMVVLCTCIGIFLALLDRGSLGMKLLYSFCIGFSCWALTDGVRIALSVVLDGRHRRLGLPPSPKGHLGVRGMLPLMLVAVLVGPQVGVTIADAISGHTSPSLFQWDNDVTRITLALSVIGSLAALAWMSNAERLAATRAAAEAAQRQAAENQLKLLESQLEPHMLFNTLATLRVLIGIDAARAQEMLDRLIAFLRATLNASRTGSHPLANEFERLADYLALMSLRMGPRLQVVLDLPDALRGVPVPPLLLQPLVENSIRHGLEPQVAGGRIEVQARRDGERLVLVVRDTGAGLAAPPAGTSKPAGSGFGLEQVRARLAALHGERARFEIRAAADGEGGTEARIELPWPTEKG